VTPRVGRFIHARGEEPDAIASNAALYIAPLRIGQERQCVRPSSNDSTSLCQRHRDRAARAPRRGSHSDDGHVPRPLRLQLLTRARITAYQGRSARHPACPVRHGECPSWFPIPPQSLDIGACRRWYTKESVARYRRTQSTGPLVRPALRQRSRSLSTTNRLLTLQR